jgi:hypothetical protein
MAKDDIAKPGKVAKKKKKPTLIDGLKRWKGRYDDLLDALGGKKPKPKPAKPGK